MNGVDHVSVAIQDDFLAQQTRAQPVAALAELIWNGLDGDASEINVELEYRDFAGGLSKIVVRDNGDGFPRSEAARLFGNLGGSRLGLPMCAWSPMWRFLIDRPSAGVLRWIGMTILQLYYLRSPIRPALNRDYRRTAFQGSEVAGSLKPRKLWSRFFGRKCGPQVRKHVENGWSVA